ncbi:transposase family protein [Micromonospora sp. DT47]|uniref:transposase family protein n=1 Tax=Micromonospora sp. DT47 TaxID=3393431 RepID=UPI003CEBD741
MLAQLLERFWQNLRRCVGWTVHHAGCVEPKRCIVRHACFAIQGTSRGRCCDRSATYHRGWTRIPVNARLRCRRASSPREVARKRHSSQRIRVEHVIGHLKNWRILGRYHGRRENLDATIRAIAGLLSDHQHTDRTENTTRPLKALPSTPHNG